MQSNAVARIRQDLNLMKTQPPGGITAGPENNDWFKWIARICGPEGTPHAGAIYKLRVTFPRNYPAQHPTGTFLSEMYHPNIWPDGRVCIRITDWNPQASTVMTFLTGVQALLHTFNKGIADNPRAWKSYHENRAEYVAKVRQLAQKSRNE